MAATPDTPKADSNANVQLEHPYKSTTYVLQSILGGLYPDYLKQIK
jgi:hypothetical protein